MFLRLVLTATERTDGRGDGQKQGGSWLIYVREVWWLGPHGGEQVMGTRIRFCAEGRKCIGSLVPWCRRQALKQASNTEYTLVTEYT
jgi:hypothetical protein